MPDGPVIQWKRILVEATAIVASILLAFAIDAWWHHRVEKVAETQYLVAIHEDFVRSRELLERGRLQANRHRVRHGEPSRIVRPLHPAR